MKAMVLSETGPIEDRPLRLAERPRPRVGPGQILIEVSVCGVCHTDLDEVEGRLTPIRLPVVPGHQIVGRVMEAADGGDALRLGRRVGVTWLGSACGRCRFCESGRENLCETAVWTGKDVDGGYAEYAVADSRYAFDLPDGLEDPQAAPLLCGGVIGYRALRLCEIRSGEVVGLFGFGASAHIVIQILRYRWPDNPVYVFTRSEAHRSLAAELGAAWTGSPGDRPPRPVAKAIDFTPVGRTVGDALGVLEKGGRLVINAIAKRDAVGPLDYHRDLWHERQIQSTANVTAEDVRGFLELAGEAPIAPQVEVFGLDQANEALQQVKQAKVRAAAVLRIR